jgi:hypothetical protein
MFFPKAEKSIPPGVTQVTSSARGVGEVIRSHLPAARYTYHEPIDNWSKFFNKIQPE